MNVSLYGLARPSFPSLKRNLSEHWLGQTRDATGSLWPNYVFIEMGVDTMFYQAPYNISGFIQE